MANGLNPLLLDQRSTLRRNAEPLGGGRSRTPYGRCPDPYSARDAQLLVEPRGVSWSLRPSDRRKRLRPSGETVLCKSGPTSRGPAPRAPSPYLIGDG